MLCLLTGIHGQLAKALNCKSSGYSSSFGQGREWDSVFQFFQVNICVGQTYHQSPFHINHYDSISKILAHTCYRANVHLSLFQYRTLNVRCNGTTLKMHGRSRIIKMMTMNTPNGRQRRFSCLQVMLTLAKVQYQLKKLYTE